MTTDTGSSADPPARADDTAPATKETAASARGAVAGETAYMRMEANPEFVGLRKAFRGFVFPMTVAFLVWYLLYVVMSAFARDFMATVVVGNINVAFIFGVLQFVSTFLIAWWYARFASRKLDPVAERLRIEVENDGGTR